MSAAQDTVIRIALASMAADPTSPLTREQRHWIIDLAHRTTALTPQERQRLQTPLLAWVKERQPRILDIVAGQFADGGAAHAPSHQSA